MLRLNSRAGLAGAVLIGTLFTQYTVAQISSDPKTNARHDRIVGLWDVEVVAGPCGGPVGPPFQAMHKYELGGTGQVVPSTNPAALSAHMLVWNHVSGNHYQAAIKFYRYNENAVAIGYTIITNDVMISDDGADYSGSGVAEFFNMDGGFEFNVCPQFSGTRFTG